jgi:UDP-N-acetyl-D-mannosaminuronate dehydrogenase
MQITAASTVSSPVVDISIHTNRASRHTVVAVVGLGCVGLPTAIALRQAGHRIVGIDVPRRLDAIRGGEVELLEEQHAALRCHLEGDGFVLTEQMQALDAADVVLVCVPTPVDERPHVDERPQPDPRVLRETCAEVVHRARPGQTLILTSTTYVGATRELLLQPLVCRGLDIGKDVFVALSPEPIPPGVERHGQLRNPRVIGGATELCSGRAEAVLGHTCEHVHRVSSPEAAEMFTLRKVSGRPRHIAKRAHELLMRSGRPLREARVLVVGVGVCHEPGVADTRQVPAVEIIERLRAEGAHVDYHDPLVPTLRVDGEQLASVRVELRGEGPNLGRGESVNVKRYDLAILATLHPGHDYGWVQRCPTVLDCTYRTLGGRRRFLP